MSTADVRARRIVFLVSAMTEGGAERVAALLSNHWAEHGHDVTLIPTFSGRGECIYPLNAKVRVSFLADRVEDSSKTPLNAVRRFATLRKMIKEAAPDIVVSFLTHVNVVALLASAGLGVPVVVSERVYPPLQPISAVWLFLSKIVYRRAAVVVAQTQGSAEWIRRHCSGARVAVIPNPVVLPISGSGPDLDPARIVRNRRFALAVGRLVEQKGFRRLIGAFAKVAAAAPDWDLVILGGGPERAALEAHLLQLGLLERVHLPGRVGNVGRWYASAGMYVLSSYYEGFPNALLEAMAYGVPSISIDCPTGPADIIRHGVDGLLVNDMDGLADGMGRLMRDERERAEMSSRAREVADRFSLDRVGALWARMLDDPRHAGAAPQEAP